MLNIQTTIIAICVSFSIGASIAGFTAWNYQSNKYEKQIAQSALKAQETLRKETQKALASERQKEDVTNDFNKRVVEQEKTISKLLADNRKYLSANGRLRIKSDSNPLTQNTSDKTPGIVANETPSTELPEGFSGYLLETLKQCDEAAAYAEVAHEYALEVEKQREELMKEEQ